MKYIITADDTVRPHSLETANSAASFGTLEELESLTRSWPLRRFVSVWNKLPRARSISRFENRPVAVHRLWRALNGTPKQSEPEQAPSSEKRSSRRKSHPTKAETVAALLGRPEGATLKLLMKTTRWQAHTVRAFISRKISKQLGLTVQSSVRDGERVYAVRPEALNEPNI